MFSDFNINSCWEITKSSKIINKIIKISNYLFLKMKSKKSRKNSKKNYQKRRWKLKKYNKKDKRNKDKKSDKKRW